jgi:hypothetical protein
MSDHDNCGGCGIVCAGARTCCSGACRNLNTNEENCGACGNACTDSERAPHCETGVCACGGATCAGYPQICCEVGVDVFSCIDTDIDRNNCGGCGVSCPVGDFCDMGICSGGY